MVSPERVEQRNYSETDVCDYGDSRIFSKMQIDVSHVTHRLEIDKNCYFRFSGFVVEK
jgi:hypothetical protein